MKTVQDIAREIVAREGGFVNDPDDPGGPTNFGVTLRELRALGMDLDGDGDVDIDDVCKLTRNQAVDIFVREYFQKPRLDLLPAALQATVFDMAVNAGQARAVIMLQELLRSWGHAVAVDGKIGPQTARIAVRAMAEHGNLVDAYGIARRDFYYAIGDRRPASRKYARRADGGKGGWIVRAEEFIAPRFHLTEAQHRARVKAWV
jgi:lysozyme family protein